MQICFKVQIHKHVMIWELFSICLFIKVFSFYSPIYMVEMYSFTSFLSFQERNVLETSYKALGD